MPDALPKQSDRVTIERWGYLQLVPSYSTDYVIESCRPGAACRLPRTA